MSRLLNKQKNLHNGTKQTAGNSANKLKNLIYFEPLTAPTITYRHTAEGVTVHVGLLYKKKYQTNTVTE